MKRYQVLINVNGYECLDTVVFGEHKAIARTHELNTAGKVARYEELPMGQAWFDDNNWIG